nr:MAG TPA: hypothetical protein [Caudoviricetes sp.]
MVTSLRRQEEQLLDTYQLTYTGIQIEKIWLIILTNLCLSYQYS